jgi:DNA-damage-inducible protein J
MNRGGVFMAKTIQVRVDDDIKSAADSLFLSLGLDTSTAVRMFLAAAVEKGGIPFSVKRNRKRKPNAELLEAMEDVRLGRNLYGPFSSAEEAVRSMLED